MKTLIKRVYCTKCEKLVTGKEQVGAELTNVSCTRCGSALWVSDGIKWLKVKTA
jgi:hypothetical protein